MTNITRQFRDGTPQRVVLLFKKVQLLHEIADYGYIEGEVMTEGTTMKQLTQDIVQGNNCARIVRHLDMAYTRALRFLSPLTDHEAEEMVRMDDVPEEREDYVVALKVDSPWTVERVEHLRNLIHNYLIYYALYLWLSITNDKVADKWKEQAEEMEDEIRYYKFGGGFYRRPFRPF